MRKSTLFAFSLSLFAAGLGAQHTHARPTPWDDAVVEAFRTLPVQEGGRVKPLDTAVQFTMYRIHGKRRMHVPDEPRFGAAAGETLDPMHWGLDVMLYPDAADTYPAFTVANSDVLTVIGLSEVVRKKRDRYSYAELSAGFRELAAKFDAFRAKEERRRTLVETQVIELGGAVLEYRGLRDALEFARASFSVPGSGPVRELFGRDTVRASDVLRAGPPLMMLVRSDDATATGLLHDVDRAMASGYFLRMFPPADPQQETWLTPRELFEVALTGGASPEQIDAVARLEGVVDSLHDPAALHTAAARLHGLTEARAAARGEYAGIELEVAYYKADFFYRALVLFLIGFLVLAVGWLAPRSKWLPRISFGLVGAGNLVLIAGVTVRCILRGRPPVLNIYDTILFISAVVVTVALLIEWINRRRIGLALAAVLGTVGMFLSYMHEMVEKADTMAPLIAVLRTNFWLATHVTTVTIGYAAGILAGAIAYVFLLGKLFGLRRGDRGFYHNLGRMVYGTVGFGVVFATVGTILGGIWANDSWGRFWGWDPKENGALMIVLWFLMMLHARMGGYVRHWGMSLLAVLGAAVVAFSWWHVNLLGKGLHAYGFTEGIAFALYTFYGVSGLVFGLGVLAYVLEKRAEQAAVTSTEKAEAATAAS